MPELEVQTRSEEGELKFFSSVTDAFTYAQNIDNRVEKISWEDSNGSRVRFVCDTWSPPPMAWYFEPLAEAVQEELNPNVFDGQQRYRVS